MLALNSLLQKVEWSPPTFTSSYDFGFCPAQAIINSLPPTPTFARERGLKNWTPQSNRSIHRPSISLVLGAQNECALRPYQPAGCCYTALSLSLSLSPHTHTHHISLNLWCMHTACICAACRDSLLHASSHARACMHIGYGPVQEGMRSIRPCDARAYSSATCQHVSKEKLALTLADHRCHQAMN